MTKQSGSTTHKTTLNTAKVTLITRKLRQGVVAGLNRELKATVTQKDPNYTILI
jgi:hypothetical protein